MGKREELLKSINSTFGKKNRKEQYEVPEGTIASIPTPSSRKPKDDMYRKKALEKQRSDKPDMYELMDPDLTKLYEEEKKKKKGKM